MSIILLWIHVYPDNIEATGQRAKVTIPGSLCPNQTIGKTTNPPQPLVSVLSCIYSDNISHFSLQAPWDTTNTIMILMKKYKRQLHHNCLLQVMMNITLTNAFVKRCSWPSSQTQL